MVNGRVSLVLQLAKGSVNTQDVCSRVRHWGLGQLRVQHASGPDPTRRQVHPLSDGGVQL